MLHGVTQFHGTGGDCVDSETAEAAVVELERILAVAGHDLKQPLHLAVMSISRAMVRCGDVVSLERLELALAALNRLGYELDDLARSSQGHVRKPDRKLFTLASLLAEIDNDWRPYAEAFGVELRVRPFSVLVETDRQMLRTIIRNLVGNAIKYAGSQGRVLVGCRRRYKGVSVEVRDNGCGISEAELGSIFDPFIRVGDPQRAEGLGLGLHIVRRTANLLGHPVTVRSSKEGGSIFSVHLEYASYFPPLDADDTVPAPS